MPMSADNYTVVSGSLAVIRGENRDQVRTAPKIDTVQGASNTALRYRRKDIRLKRPIITPRPDPAAGCISPEAVRVAWQTADNGPVAIVLDATLV